MARHVLYAYVDGTDLHDVAADLHPELADDSWECSVVEPEPFCLPGRYTVTASGQVFLYPHEGGPRLLIRELPAAPVTATE